MRFKTLPLLAGSLALAGLTCLALRMPVPMAAATGSALDRSRTLVTSEARRSPPFQLWTLLASAARGRLQRPWALPSRTLVAPHSGRGGTLRGRTTPGPTAPLPRGSRTRTVIDILTAAARAQRLDPGLVLAVAYWESGWRQSTVSPAGAVGIMQVEPYSAAWAGPALLHRRVDVRDLTDNAAVGTALLRSYLDEFGDQTAALEAYNQGPASLQSDGVTAGAERYAEGVEALAARIDRGDLPTPPPAPR